MRRRLCEASLYDRIRCQKPQLKQNNVKKLQWTKVPKDWTTEQWNEVLWTDESKFEIFSSNRRFYMQRRVGEKAAIPCITPTKKYGGDCFMMWWAFAHCKGRDLHQVKGKLNQTGYHNILQHQAILSGTRLVGQGFVHMQNNDPKYTNKLCQRYIKSKEEQHVLRLMLWSVQSMDLNPIEIEWDELE